MIKESLRINLQRWIAWDRNWDCRKHLKNQQVQPASSRFFALVHFFIVRKDKNVTKVYCNTVQEHVHTITRSLRVTTNFSQRVNNTVIKELSNHFELLLVSVKLLTIKCFQERISLIIYNISHVDIYLLCWVLIYSNIRKNIFLCCPPGAVFIKVVVSLFSCILLAIFLLIPVVHCQHYKPSIWNFQKWLLLWCESSLHKPYKGDFGCISTYMQLCTFQERKIKYEALIRNGADLKETLNSILPETDPFLSFVHFNNSEQQWESKGEHFSSPHPHFRPFWKMLQEILQEVLKLKALNSSAKSLDLPNKTKKLRREGQPQLWAFRIY